MLSLPDIKHFPTDPGVYLMKDSSDRIIYVGKALNLKKRVSSYFTKSGDSRYQIRFLLSRVTSIDWIVTDTEKEALILENTLIKKHRPRYNLNLRDDKTYFSLRLDPAEEFPRLAIIRKVTRDGARYFGPYASASAAREVLKELCRIFPLRHYPLESCRRRKRPCLYYQLKQCSAPCYGHISKEEYAALVEGAALFLSGRNREIVRIFKERMAVAASREAFEEAGKFRDLIRAIEQTVERQKVAATGGDSDVVGIIAADDQLHVSILFIRNGLLIGSRNYSFPWELDLTEGLASFLSSYYSQEVIIPDEIVVPLLLSDAPALAELFSEKRGKKVTITHPRRGAKLELVLLAGKNAVNVAEEKKKKAKDRGGVLEDLMDLLHLEQIPARIECYDISNIQGRMAVGSRVTFIQGEPEKSLYRKYRIQTIDQADDFGMMREVLSRRFANKEDSLPDMILVDGGIGQLNILSTLLEELGIIGIDLAGLAKSRVQAEMTAPQILRSDERIFRPGRKNPIILRQNSAPLLLLARIRDEAHRFAIGYHKKLRGKAALLSALDSIPGIGPARREALLKRFGTVESLREADVEEIAALPGISRQLAKELLNILSQNLPD
jgi:excinuclease ABC subunit C